MMTIMLSEVYDALVAAGVSNGLEARFVRVEGEAAPLKWMIGFVLAFQAGIFVELFLH